MNFGGMDNELDPIGENVLQKILSAEFERDVSTSPEINAITFNELRENCIRERQLFEDPEFPADDSVLYFSRNQRVPVRWLRPHQIAQHPQLINVNPVSSDALQGHIGNCWLISAAALLATNPGLFYRVVLPDQSFAENYAGIFHFNFFQYGRWVDIVIDDRIPCKMDGQLLYSYARQQRVFWAILLEKAFAKLYTNYRAINSGHIRDALADFTGGLTESKLLNNSNIIELERTLMSSGLCLFGCNTGQDQNVAQTGLILKHAYAVMKTTQVITLDQRSVTMLLIRNPWGRQSWSGQYAQSAMAWFNFPQHLRESMQNEISGDTGQFWITVYEFVQFFETLHICYLGPEAIEELTIITEQPIPSMWDSIMFEGEWVIGQTAGGHAHIQNIRNFARNPQFLINVQSDAGFILIISLLQKFRRERGLSNIHIGFIVFNVIDHQFLSETDFPRNCCAKSRAFFNQREVTDHFRLPPGNYVIIPSSFDPGTEGEFLLRIFTNGTIYSYRGTPYPLVKEKRYRFTDFDHIRMWRFVIAEINSGNLRAKYCDEQFWQKFKNEVEFVTTAGSIEKHFRGIMKPKLVNAKLPKEELFFLFRFFKLRLTEENRQRLESEHDCKIICTHRNIFMHAHSSTEDTTTFALNSDILSFWLDLINLKMLHQT